MATRMLQRRGTAAEWAAENPILADGEMGFETDSKIIKMGDGVTPWVDLGVPYVSTGGGVMTGALSLVAPTADAHGVRRVDLDNKLTGLQETVVFTADGSFIKATYPWLRAVRARLVGGGGGGAGSNTASSSGAGGGSGAVYSEVLVSVDDLLDSETVTVGGYGDGGAVGADGVAGSPSSFGGHAVAEGGNLGQTDGTGGAQGQGTLSSGDFVAVGNAGVSVPGPGGGALGGAGGASHLGGGARGRSGSGAGDNCWGYGGGGGGGARVASGGVTGGRGGDGVVVVELYA